MPPEVNLSAHPDAHQRLKDCKHTRPFWKGQWACTNKEHPNRKERGLPVCNGIDNCTVVEVLRQQLAEEEQG